MDKLLKDATPPTASTVVAPLRVPPAGLVPVARVTEVVVLVTVFPSPSWTATVTAGLIDVPAAVLVGCWMNASLLAAPGVMLKGALLAVVRALAVALSV